MDPQKQEYEANKLQKRLRRLAGQAIADFDMIHPGDRVMVCLSGGKDSYALLDVLLSLKAHAPVDFEVMAFNLDQKHPGYPERVLPGYLSALGIPFRIVEQDTYGVVKRVIPEGKTMCSLCSRLRRGVIYRVAKEMGATKIALGHHRDDILETFFLNLFYGGKLKAMPPKLTSDDGQHIVIRPLAYASEADLSRYAEVKRFPIIPCNLCGSQDNLHGGNRIGENPARYQSHRRDPRTGRSSPRQPQHRRRGRRPKTARARLLRAARSPHPCAAPPTPRGVRSQTRPVADRAGHDPRTRRGRPR